ncbi:Synembryn-like protein C3E7.04c [Cyphellophora attinorum]|uniref:Synembryn-like protein C3E7.04c n=1 Tax=Cyphellophora attinorum TaxID=1664694 RepID=A0A0N1I1N8_9EURO|nr:Synembryn-like protein C3E7.04c [Phialophora attinorum]KPI45845.1 Synembryn-like protein C3E7.04c [Phialophora attinorum]
MQTAQSKGGSAVKALLAALKNDHEQKTLTDDQREQTLAELKALGRDVNSIKGIYDGQTVSLFLHYGLGAFPKAVQREALRCLANALILVPSTQDALAKSARLPSVADYYDTPEDDDEFLGARILFLMTYNASANMAQIVKDNGLAGKVCSQLRRHESMSESLVGAGMTSMALSETLKLIFNIVNLVPQCSQSFTVAVPVLYAMLEKAQVPNPPLQPPLTYLLNAIACIDAGEGEDATIAASRYLPDVGILPAAVDKLVSILDKALVSYTASQLDTQLISLLTILRRVNALAGQSMRTKLKQSLLPSDNERDLPLGQSSTLASRLLKLVTGPGLTHLPEAVSSLLFELSDKDAHKYVQNVGYGYAAGYLMTHKIPIPENAKGASPGSTPINPVTGQRLDKEPDIPQPKMSKEEKEREAERLFVLFERLKATGVMDVKNPVEQARDEGRLQEASDSE